MDYKSRPLSKYNKDLSDFLDNVPNSDNIKRMLFDDDKDLSSFRRNGFGTLRPRTYFDTNSFFDRARDDTKHSSFDDNFRMFKTEPLRMHTTTWSAPSTPNVVASSSNSAPSTPPIIASGSGSGSGTASPLTTSPSRENQKEFDSAIDNLQSIQQDITSLMDRIEDFKGHEKSTEYTYLDEMLTRNLIKLDTVDCMGNINLRLAKKEAIKCIEQAIMVLEAKGSNFSGSSI